ncbi:protein of unknown function [Cupriavidus taiwanensis]|uniref:Uncharacterized protein n=1 Tax=Cupriavidus taiwanensis TaxID=164546 RepID=A0A375IA98_9BURK|nr:protein of unknown function [Cupriavidus taiwanensis]
MMDAAGPAGKKRPYSLPLKADPVFLEPK